MRCLKLEGHFVLVGAACHAELASREHGWARVKARVKPYADGTMSKLEEIVSRSIHRKDRIDHDCSDSSVAR